MEIHSGLATRTPEHHSTRKVGSTCSTRQHLVQGHHPISAPTCHRAMSFVYKYLSAASKLLEGGRGREKTA